MKKNILIAIAFITFLAQTQLSFGQDIPQSQVPSIVLNSFQKSFPKAFDIEWELDGDLYKVEFETGVYAADHDAWYDKTGKLVRHKEEISKSELPKKILAKLSNEYSKYRIDEIKKITGVDGIVYNVDLRNFAEKWKLAMDAEGNVLNKVED